MGYGTAELLNGGIEQSGGSERGAWWEQTLTALTARERQVADLIASGLATKEIAAALDISTHTARHHTERVFQKLGVQTRSAVAALLLSDGRVGHSSHLAARRTLS
jgi:DNA-binding CsgD family transcriptional regulator